AFVTISIPSQNLLAWLHERYSEEAALEVKQQIITCVAEGLSDLPDSLHWLAGMMRREEEEELRISLQAALLDGWFQGGDAELDHFLADQAADPQKFTKPH
ncbi:MAG: hypothetical protein COB37_06510, partial [Kordiimonadales bacterium]